MTIHYKMASQLRNARKERIWQVGVLSFFFLLINGCSPFLPTAEAGAATLSIEEQVAGTLAAFQPTLALTLSDTAPLTEPGDDFSMEVTQEVFLATPATLIDSGDQELPTQYHIYNIWGHRQYFAIGCEAATATDWAAFFGVVVNEFNFQYQLPQSDNPDLGFVGGVEGPWGQVPPYAYGVHAAPVAKVLRENYGLNAQGMKGFTLEELKAEIAANRPVIAWVIGNCVGGVPYEYTDSQGNTTIVAAYEHVVIVTGYTEDTIRYMNNGKFYDIPTEYFLNSWGILGNMVVYLETG